MIFTTNIDEIKYYCDVLQVISTCDVLFFGEIVQDVICNLQQLSPPCNDFFSGILRMKGGCEKKIILPTISCIGDHRVLAKSQIVTTLGSLVISSIKRECLNYFKIWNGTYSVDVVFVDNIEIRHEADNLIWSRKDGFEFFYDPVIEQTSMFEPFSIEILRRVDKLIERCVKKKTILHELDVETCWKLIGANWHIENIFSPATNIVEPCMICKENFVTEDVAVTNCGRHNFHQFCLLKWWDHSKTIYGCAVCKNKIVVKPYEICDEFDEFDDIEVELP